MSCAELNKIPKKKKIPLLILVPNSFFSLSICLFLFYFCKRGNIETGAIVSSVSIANLCGLFCIFPRDFSEGFWALHLARLADASIAWVSSLAPCHTL